ncbi:proton-conducting transporter membrane subunit [Cystobacter fuscus]
MAVGPATALGLCLMLAAMGKSAQLPFSNWLPRAMEGPTPSSALFYGALSVHAGVYLLLRVAPLLQRSAVASGVLVVVGLLTAVHATLVWRVQTDVKSSLAYGVLTQVGLMFAEVGLGLYRLALVHRWRTRVCAVCNCCAPRRCCAMSWRAARPCARRGVPRWRWPTTSSPKGGGGASTGWRWSASRWR